LSYVDTLSVDVVVLTSASQQLKPLLLVGCPTAEVISVLALSVSPQFTPIGIHTRPPWYKLPL